MLALCYSYTEFEAALRLLVTVKTLAVAVKQNSVTRKTQWSLQ